MDPLQAFAASTGMPSITSLSSSMSRSKGFMMYSLAPGLEGLGHPFELGFGGDHQQGQFEPVGGLFGPRSTISRPLISGRFQSTRARSKSWSCDRGCRPPDGHRPPRRPRSRGSPEFPAGWILMARESSMTRALMACHLSSVGRNLKWLRTSGSSSMTASERHIDVDAGIARWFIRRLSPVASLEIQNDPRD